MFVILKMRVRTNQWDMKCPSSWEWNIISCSLICFTKFLLMQPLWAVSVRNHSAKEKDKEEIGCACLHNRKHWQATISRVEKKEMVTKKTLWEKKKSANFHLLSCIFFLFTFHLRGVFFRHCSKTTSRDLQAWLPPKMESNLLSVSCKSLKTLQKANNKRGGN